MAQGYNGDKGTSTVNEEVLTNPVGLSIPREYYELSFLNTQACTVKINGDSNAIPLNAEQGIQININDAKISSLIIVEAGIEFIWFGKF